MWQGQRTRWTRLLRGVFPGGEASGDPEWGNARGWQRKAELWNETAVRSGRPHLGLGVLVTVIDWRQGRAEGRGHGEDSQISWVRQENARKRDLRAPLV